MGRVQFHLGAAFVLLLLALCLGSLIPSMGAPLSQQPFPLAFPELRIRGSVTDSGRPPDSWVPASVSAVDPGPCPAPSAACEVVRRGLDRDGLATWWHRDGTIVKITTERLRGMSGGELLLPVVVTSQG